MQRQLTKQEIKEEIKQIWNECKTLLSNYFATLKQHATNIDAIQYEETVDLSHLNQVILELQTLQSTFLTNCGNLQSALQNLMPNIIHLKLETTLGVSCNTTLQWLDQDINRLVQHNKKLENVLNAIKERKERKEALNFICANLVLFNNINTENYSTEFIIELHNTFLHHYNKENLLHYYWPAITLFKASLTELMTTSSELAKFKDIKKFNAASQQTPLDKIQIEEYQLVHERYYKAKHDINHLLFQCSGMRKFLAQQSNEKENPKFKPS